MTTCTFFHIPTWDSNAPSRWLHSAGRVTFEVLFVAALWGAVIGGTVVVERLGRPGGEVEQVLARLVAPHELSECALPGCP